jgi:hypothetical protein
VQDDDPPVIARPRGDVWVMRFWWILFPSFTLLTLRLCVERMCQDPYNLLPSLMSRPGWAWPLAATYLFAHVWILAVWLTTVSRSQELIPRLRAYQTVWGSDAAKLLLMLSVFIIEYSPVSLWHMVGRSLQCTR